MCRLHLDAYGHLTGRIAIPGIGQRIAPVIVAETGGI